VSAVLEDVTSSAIHFALNGLAKRQRVTADNIANIETPGFLAGRVQFEDALAQAVTTAGGGSDTGFNAAAKGADGSTSGSGVDYTQDMSDEIGATARSLEPTRTNGNNVNLDHETISNVDTKLRYQLMLRAMDDKFGLLGSVMKGA
jgi:flagellar basal-body rod protein FlgB